MLHQQAFGTHLQPHNHLETSIVHLQTRQEYQIATQPQFQPQPQFQDCHPEPQLHQLLFPQFQPFHHLAQMILFWNE